jgi:hypothetical protein
LDKLKAQIDGSKADLKEIKDIVVAALAALEQGNG